MHTTPTHILNPDPTTCSTLLALLQLVSCEHQFSIHYIEVFCCEAVCLFFVTFSNISLQTPSATLAETLCATTCASPCRGARRHLHICLSCLSSVFLSPPIIIIINNLFSSSPVPGGCDHPQQGVQSRAGDRGVQSHNQVPPPSTQSQNHSH